MVLFLSIFVFVVRPRQIHLSKTKIVQYVKKIFIVGSTGYVVILNNGSHGYCCCNKRGEG